MIRLGTVCIVSLSTALAVSAGDWPQFKGGNGSGVAPDVNLPTEWSKTAGLKWKAALPARGVSGAVVAAGKVYVTCSSGLKDDRLHVLCFDAATGKELWHRQFAATGGTACHPMTCMAAPTPAADATGVYALFATGDLAAIDADGNLRWYRSLTGDYPTISNQVGMASSPVLVGDRVIVPMDNVGESFIAALDIKTGKNLWKAERSKEINWVTPLVRKVGDKTEVLFAGPSGLTAYDVATGEKRWTYKNVRGSIPSGTVEGDTFVYPGGGVTAVKLGPEGVVGDPLWASPKAQSGFASPLVYADRVFTIDREGFLAVTDLKTGKLLFRERTKGATSASPIGGDGKVYVVSEKGTTTVIRADSAAFDVIAENDLGEEVLGTPAVANGNLFIRTDKGLYCIGK